MGDLFVGPERKKIDYKCRTIVIQHMMLWGLQMYLLSKLAYNRGFNHKSWIKTRK